MKFVCFKLTWRFKEKDLHPDEGEAFSEGVSEATFLLVKDLRDDEKIVEEKDFALMQPGLVPLVQIMHLVKPKNRCKNKVYLACIDFCCVFKDI